MSSNSDVHKEIRLGQGIKNKLRQAPVYLHLSEAVRVHLSPPAPKRREKVT